MLPPDLLVPLRGSLKKKTWGFVGFRDFGFLLRGTSMGLKVFVGFRGFVGLVGFRV